MRFPTVSIFAAMRRPLAVGFVALAVGWFALGSALKVMVASAYGQKIEIVVCSGAGMKTYHIPVDNTAAEAVTTLKHCANAPLAAFVLLPAAPALPQFEAPRTVASWARTEPASAALRAARDGRPPPGRAPPPQTLA